MNALLAAQDIDPWIAFFSLVTVVITVGIGLLDRREVQERR